jgi:hypothetical protein
VWSAFRGSVSEGQFPAACCANPIFFSKSVIPACFKQESGESGLDPRLKRSEVTPSKNFHRVRMTDRLLRVGSAKLITDFQINLFGEFRAADFGAFAAHSFYHQGAAIQGDGDFFRADSGHLSGGCRIIC